MLKPTTCLTFDDRAGAAVALYLRIFPNSRIISTTYAPSGLPIPEGSVLMIEFELDGQRLLALNGGPSFSFSESMSLSVECKSQTEIDDLWDRLSEGGEPGRCGWLKDRFGVSWQIVPAPLRSWIADPDRTRARRVTDAMLKMAKLDLAALRDAAR